MKAKRYNPVAAIRNALIAGGYSVVRVTNAVNSALGELEASAETSKLGDGRITKSAYKVTEATTTKYEGDVASLPLRFDAWCGAVAKADKIASFESIDIPVVFSPWLQKMKEEKTEPAKVAAPVTAK